jgi:hypothetical protein
MALDRKAKKMGMAIRAAVPNNAKKSVAFGFFFWQPGNSTRLSP